jgi:hypothetical protein
MHRSSTILLVSISAVEFPQQLHDNTKNCLNHCRRHCGSNACNACFVGGIVGFALYSVGNSQAAEIARNFLRNNEKLKNDIGEVKEFGSLVTGSVNIDDDNGQATINLKVVGAHESVNASVKMIFASWTVVASEFRFLRKQVRPNN